MSGATIRDVAAVAGVSVASVSRALNDLGNVRPETRRRIEEAARALGYIPHAGARSLSMAKTHSVGVLLPDLHGEFFSELLRGLDAEANRRGYLLLFSNLHAGTAQAAAALKAMRGKVDGLVVMAPHLDELQVAKALPPSLRTVLINAPGEPTSHSNIRIDNRAGVRTVVEHLRALGRERIAYLGGPADNVDARERAAAFDEISGPDPLHIEGDFSVESGRAAAERLLAVGEGVDALCAANDMMALGAMQVLEAAGRRIPEDISVTGFDDVPLAEFLNLTTVRVRIAELGARALGVLVDELDDPARTSISERHAPDLVIRRSTAGT